MSINSRRHLQISFAGDADFSGEPVEYSVGFYFILIIVSLLSFITCALLLDLIVHYVVRWSCGGFGPLPLSSGRNSGEIRQLPIVIHSSECSICLKQIEMGERVRLLPNCGHSFHVACIDRWLAVRSSCPTCRQTPFAAGVGSSECDEPEKAVWKALNRELVL